MTQWSYDTSGLDTGTCTEFNWRAKRVTLEGPDGSRQTYYFERHAQASSFMRHYGARHDADMKGIEITVQYVERDGKRYETTFTDK